ncbi:hypothetical protein B0H10DRAFT_1961591 [Mycena sp. CBHHK59/15]|nr:hypothetical protein B0H10DRAFT_1961591 [Mycena sp. CBHHK59/15]
MAVAYFLGNRQPGNQGMPRFPPEPLPPSDIGININDDGDVGSEDEQDQDMDDIDDDSGVSLLVVIDRVLHVQDPSGRWVAKVGVHTDGEAQISAGDAEEDIWAYNPRGELWAKGGVPADDSDSESEKAGSGDSYEPGDN